MEKMIEKPIDMPSTLIKNKSNEIIPVFRFVNIKNDVTRNNIKMK